MTDLDLDALRAELADFARPKKPAGRSPREERILAGFEEIQRFTDAHGRVPQHGEDRDIFERLYAVRLDRLRTLEECRTLLESLDHQGLLSGAAALAVPEAPEAVDADMLRAELAGAVETSDITTLRHVRSTAEKRAADEIANREPCPDFDRFKPLFEQVRIDLDAGIRTTRPFGKTVGFQKADIAEEQFFIS